jgi:hypothetical protein
MVERNRPVACITMGKRARADSAVFRVSDAVFRMVVLLCPTRCQAGWRRRAAGSYFEASPVDRKLAEQLASCGFTQAAHNVVHSSGQKSRRRSVRWTHRTGPGYAARAAL